MLEASRVTRQCRLLPLKAGRVVACERIGTLIASETKHMAQFFSPYWCGLEWPEWIALDAPLAEYKDAPLEIRVSIAFGSRGGTRWLAWGRRVAQFPIRAQVA